ncbi:putative transcriptional regulator YdeE [Pedobacter sp. CG_S7]|uniref:GyrI-like domain-containing protein n=1 Tax=Pedobacter sp. CG_S7 TaxID=3143930 RepID=UPI0033970619
MSIQKIGAFSIIGISVRTTNENGQASKDIPALWGKFMSDGVLEKIPNKVDNTLYCIYTDYQKDHTKPYTTILGCKVQNLNNVPEDMVSKTFEDADYEKFVATGNLMQGAVIKEWTKIWSSDLKRAFTADFEVYDNKSIDPENAVVDIFIAV